MYPIKQNASKRRPRPELTEEQKQEIKEAFDLFDINKDGINFFRNATSTR